MIKQTILVISIFSIVVAKPLITGQVFNDKGKPLSFAVITDKSTQHWVITDETGRFVVNFPTEKGDTLFVNRYGYKKTKFIINDHTFYGIDLKPKPISIDAVSVPGSQDNLIGTISNTYYNNFTDINSKIILDQVPGIIIRTYGGNAGNISIGTIGSSATHTKILLGNIDLTSAQNGETDASQIPPAMLNQISVANSPGIFYGSGASDAAIKIDPIQDRSSFILKYGSFNQTAFDGNYQSIFGKTSLNLLGGYFYDHGNFKYTLPKHHFGNRPFFRRTSLHIFLPP
jgi:hypothetical protein